MIICRFEWGMNYANYSRGKPKIAVANACIRCTVFFFSWGLSLMAGLTANGQNKAHPSFRFSLCARNSSSENLAFFTLHQAFIFESSKMCSFSYPCTCQLVSTILDEFIPLVVGGHFDWQIVIFTASDSSLGKWGSLSLIPNYCDGNWKEIFWYQDSRFANGIECT